MGAAEEIRIDLGDGEAVDGLWLDAPDAVLVLAHGAGAGMRHAFMSEIAERLGDRGVATLRYDFPYITAGRRLPPRADTLTGFARAAVEYALARGGARPIWAGGKSMGARVTSMAEASCPLGVRGLAFLGFPLHPAGKPGTSRADHLRETTLPLRFVSGTRDSLADRPLLVRTVTELGMRAELRLVEAADHGFDVLIRSGRTRDDVLDEIADTVAEWVA